MSPTDFTPEQQRAAEALRCLAAESTERDAKSEGLYRAMVTILCSIVMELDNPRPGASGRIAARLDWDRKTVPPKEDDHPTAVEMRDEVLRAFSETLAPKH